MARIRRQAAEWAALIDQWLQSGLSLPAFCQRHGLSRGSMQIWVYKPELKRAVEEAISYSLNHWAALIRPLEAGFLEIDNGASERAMKPVALGRKNWLFAGSDEGGKTAATLMSLCTTCKDLGVDPFAYLRDVLERVSTHPNSRIDELLPDRWKPLEGGDPSGRKG